MSESSKFVYMLLCFYPLCGIQVPESSQIFSYFFILHSFFLLSNIVYTHLPIFLSFFWFHRSGLAARDDSDSDSSDGICITCLDRIVYHNGHKEPHIGDIELA
ncbi:uncharacterized protein C8R40DRAFT_1109778 [Lentinula edodes]|uniref:uncharacterized protein n=1 Tax=Lentinula edodes TaxID=5353 RepID=UPI001E8D147D|nr:uncharacterized protein C8R40DRAFT_1109778 [Lentinula edodes]KAH7874190.1 hypothetical protein C8R40DRAFT_1109778 [Lentinula edodes]